MPTVFLSKILFVHKLLNSFLLYLLPKKLRTYLSSSCCQEHQKQSFNPQKQTKPTPPRSSSSSRRMDSNDLKRVFQMFDRNGDGRITKRELGDSLENMGIFIPDKELAQMIEKIDVDGDGCVDIDEFKDLYKTIMDERDEEEDMREAFNVFDQNGDGFITVDELKSVLSSLGLKRGRTVEDCKKMITRVDADGDGMVNFVEFKQMMMGAGLASLA